MAVCCLIHLFLILETGTYANLLWFTFVNNSFLFFFSYSAVSVVWRQKVNIKNNRIHEKPINILSISGSSLHFHCSFVADKVSLRGSVCFLTHVLYAVITFRYLNRQQILLLK